MLRGRQQNNKFNFWLYEYCVTFFSLKKFFDFFQIIGTFYPCLCRGIYGGHFESAIVNDTRQGVAMNYISGALPETA